MPVVTLDRGVAISYWERGAVGGSALVLLPGPTDSWRSYEPVLPSLPEGLGVVAVSLRGHGDSSKPPTGYGIEDLASDVVPLLDALAIERALLAGHSGSCLVARRVALDAPERVAGLLLESSPTTLRGDARLQDFVDHVVSGLTDPLEVEVARSFIAETSSGDLAPDLVDLLVEELRKVPIRAWQEMFASLLQYDDTPEISGIAAPARLLWGDADPLVSRAMQDELVHRLPRADLVVYPGAGHTPRWVQPERFARDASTFASEVLR